MCQILTYRYYKKEGNSAAIKLGYSLVNEDIKNERVQKWIDFIKLHPDAMLYCFRGGQRSKLSQEFIKERGKDIVRLKGGYKAFRNYLMSAIDDSIQHFKPLVLGGRTGSGKTILLKQIKNSVDLEGLANHRGSSFGRKTSPQPTQINFENNLAYDLIQKLEKNYNNLIFEDEGKFVGSVYIPKTFASYLSNAPLLILETPLQERIEITFDEYIVSSQESYKNLFTDSYLQRWKEDVESALKRISRRLGGQKYKILSEIFSNAITKQIDTNSQEQYKEFIKYLLVEYYDPMYDYQIKKNSSRIVYSGSANAIMDYFIQK